MSQIVKFNEGRKFFIQVEKVTSLDKILGAVTTLDNI